LEAENILWWYFGFSAMTLSALLFAFYYESLHPFILELVMGFTLLLAYICILYTQSRGGYMGLFVGMVLFCLTAGRKVLFDNWKKLAVLGGLILLISGITMSRPEFSPFQRFTSEITTQKQTAEEKPAVGLELKGAAGSRGETWKSAFRIIADNPIFGIGPEVLKMVFPRYETDLFRFKEAFHVKQDRCHNETFDVSVTKGLISFFVYGWLLFVLFRSGWLKSQRVETGEKIMLSGLLAAALAYLIQNQFSFGVVAITSLFWVIWGMTMVTGEEAVESSTKKFSLDDVPWIPVAAVVAVVWILIYCFFLSFRGDISFKSGKTALEFRHLNEAVMELEKSVAISPFEGATISHLGIAYLNLAQMTTEKNDHMRKAVLALNYGTRADPYNADNFYMLSRIYLMRYSEGEKESLKVAKTYADYALKIDPYYAEVYFNLGQIYEREGENGKAVVMYEKTFMLNPNLTEPLDKLEELNRLSGKPGETLKVLERARARYADNYTVLDKIAALLLEKKQFNDLMKVADQMIIIDDKNSAGYISRAEAYLGQNMLEKSFSDLQQVMVNDPGNIAAHSTLGKYYLIKGDRQKAKEEYQQVLILDPQNKLAKEMLGKL
jgi:tetratricopeptide (TPR) repeat protein